MAFTIATWNVNSIRVRRERLLAFLVRHSPDVLCLQELKCEETAFPWDDVQAAGYHAVVLGQKTYNGVAILSKQPPEQVQRGWVLPLEGDAQARVITAYIGGIHIINLYVPNGSEVGSDKFAYKMRWFSHLRDELERRFSPQDSVLMCGDFNVAPEDIDAANPERWKDSVLCHPEARDALKHVADWGFRDGFRQKHPEPGLYSWWDYRNLGFPKNDGLRIDHLYVTEPLLARVQDAFIDRDERKGVQPSDHVPVILKLTT